MIKLGIQISNILATTNKTRASNPLIALTPDGDKLIKSKGKKTERHCNVCGQDGHLEPKCFKKLEVLRVAMENHNINLDSSSSSSSSHGHALFASDFSFNATSTSSSNEWLIDYEASYHMDKDKAIFYALNEYNTKQIHVDDDRPLSVVGFGTRQLD